MARVLDTVTMPIKKNGTKTPQEYVNNPKSTAPQFSASTAYTVGQYVFYEKKLYRFKAAHAAGAWNSAHVDEVTVASELVSHGTDITQLKADLTQLDETAAKIDGSYDDLTAGNAKQLESTQYVEDSDPYLFRTSGGSSDIGNREYVRAIVGGSVAWNQLFDFTGVSRTVTSNGITMVISNGMAVFNGTTETNGAFEFWYRVNKPETIVGHVYMYWVNKVSGAHTGTVNFVLAGIGNANTGTGTTPRIGKAVLASDRCDCYIGAGTSTDYTLQFQVIDLTATLCDSTIADYVYSLEQSEAGSGIAWLKKNGFFLKKYYPYCEPDFRHVQGLVSHDMVEFNQWNEEWELGAYNNTTGAPIASSNTIRTKNAISVIAGAVYCVRSSNAKYLYWYDDSDNFIKYEYVAMPSAGYFTVTAPSNARYLRAYWYGTSYANDTCINLNWSGTHNGEYQTYEKHSYPLDHTVVLRGFPKLDASGNLYYDGDRYLPDGTVSRRLGIVDLGTLKYGGRSVFDTVDRYYTNELDALAKNYGRLISTIFINNNILSPWCAWFTTGNGKAYFTTPNNQYANTAEFKAAMSGVYLLYELATPTEETAEPYQEVQICNDWGTEEYVIDSEIDVPVPVGHETRYPANLRDKLQHLPDLADNDGYYAIKQVGTQMSLELFRIPKAPETDGTYTLKATVASGTPTYTWESEVTEG